MNEITKIRIKRIFLIAVVTIAILVAFNALIGTQWMLFYNWSMSGKVIDAETNQPIQEAIVVDLWQLSEFWSEGYGGYAKVSLVKTDKDGAFRIPCWVRFKPWKFYMLLHDNAPQIAIYKPGYRLHWSSQAKKNEIELSPLIGQDFQRFIEGRSINPAKLVKVHTDDERIQNYHDWGSARFPGGVRFPFNHFSHSEIRIIASALEEEIADLSDSNKDKRSILRYLKSLP